jgi:hypothetical protein
VRVRIFAFLVTLSFAAPLACSRPSAATAPDASPAASATAAPAVASGSASAPARLSSSSVTSPSMAGLFTPVEARRAIVTRLADEPFVLPQAAAIEKHFGASYLPLALQDALLANGDHALLLTSTKRARREAGVDAGVDDAPLLMLVTGDKKLVWSKERPVAGVVPGVTEIAIAPAPDGRVFLTLYDPPTRVVAGRIWDADGAPFGDFQLMTLDACDALSTFWWPGRGFVVVAAWHGAARAQMLTEGGMLAWGEGAPMGAAWREAAPISLVHDGTDGFIAVQHAHGEDGDHALAFRYDRLAKMTWPRPLDLGVVPRVADPKTRIPLTRVLPGLVETKLAATRTVRIAASGHIVTP